jgi:Flp pilus assembly protein TadD
MRTYSPSRWLAAARERACRRRDLLRRFPPALVLGAAVVWILFLGGTTQSQTHSSSAYELPYGAGPYLPSQAQTDFAGFLKTEEIPTAEYCSHCHTAAHDQWRQSAHANSFRAPFYRRNVQLLIDEKGIAATRHCEGCHNPMALFTGALTPGSTVARPFDEDGITCVACHSIVKIQNTSGTGSYVMGVPAVMMKPDGTPVRGMPDYPEVMANPDLHRRAVMRDFYRQPEFCAVCHKAALPRQLNGYKWLRAFSVYDEWQQASWSRQSPLPYYAKAAVTKCQNCHMPREPETIDAGAKDGTLASHRWVGANTAIPTVYGFDEQLRRVEAFLKSGVLGLDLFALTKTTSRGSTLFAPMDRKPFTLLPGETVIVDLLVQNRGIGHSLVPEQRDFYECWVEFQVTDATGRSIFHSGALSADGRLNPGAHSYTNALVSKDGTLLDRHQVWQTRTRAYDSTILPGRSDLVRYGFRIPHDARGPLTVKAKVNYRRFRRDFTDWIFGTPREFPIVEMASLTTTLNLGNNVGTPPREASADLLRWNNYGIALLEQQEYARAADAFRTVIALGPTYVDGYINLGVAQYSDTQYDAALKTFEQALKLDPGNLRALAHEGLMFRLEFRLDKAIDALQRVLAAYPRFRLGRQELAYAYYLQNDYQRAREQYEALQAIDPDDILAHRYLAAIYGKLGLNEKASAQGAYYQDRLDDPSIAYLRQGYWRKHMTEAVENIPFHVHSVDSEYMKQQRARILRPDVIWPDRSFHR